MTTPAKVSVNTAPAKKKLAMKDLSPEARAAAEARALSGSWDLKGLLRLLSELSYCDEAAEQGAKSALTRMVVCIVLIFPSVFLAMMFPVLALLPVAFVGLAIYYGLKRRKLRKMDMSDDFRLSLRPVLLDLANDLAQDKKIRLQMNVAGPIASKQTSKKELPPGRFQKLTETIFTDPWCEIRLPLLDGSTAAIDFENCYYKYERRYRASSGKTKWKTKWVKECTAAATLLPASPTIWKQQQLEARVDPSTEKLKYVEKEGVNGARLERYWSFKAAVNPPGTSPPPKEIIGMLLRLHGAMGGGPGAPAEAVKT